MENASKALIIAGAILLAIVIISLGLVVINNSRGAIDNANISEQEIQSFNAKIIPYKGEKVPGSKVNSLIQQVMAMNQSIKDNGETNFVCIGFPTSTNGKYVAFCNGTAKPYTGTRDTAYNAVTNKTDATNWPNSIMKKRDDILVTKSGNATASYALAVDTGKTYKVELAYDDSSALILGIAVTAN